MEQRRIVSGSATFNQEVLCISFKMWLRILPLAIATILGSAMALFAFFGGKVRLPLGIAWLVALSGVSILWLAMTIHDVRSPSARGRSFLYRHMACSGMTAALLGAAYVGLLPGVDGFDSQVLVVALVMFLLAGVTITRMVPGVAVVWGSILSVSAYAAIILTGGDRLALSLAGFSFVVAYVVASSVILSRLNRERLVYQVQAESARRELSMLFDQSPLSIVLTDTGGNIVRVNRKMEELSGYQAEELVGRNPRILKTGDTPESVYRDLWQTITLGKTWNGEFLNRNKQGTKYVEKASISPILGFDGEIKNYMAIKEDMTIQKGFEQQLKKQSEFIALLMHDFENQSNDWLWELDSDSRITYVSSKILNYFGNDSIIGQPVNDFLIRYAPVGDSEADQLIDKIIAALQEGEPFTELQTKLVIGDRTEWFVFSAVPMLAPNGIALGWRGVGREISDGKQLEQQLYRRANFDEATGLPNRHRFQELINEHIHSDYINVKAILGILNLGKLDPIRAELGSSACNAIIDAFIQLFKSILGDDVVLARLARNEFAFWAAHPDADMMDRIHNFARSVNQSLKVGKDSFYLDLYAGLAFFPEDGPDTSDIFRAADLALNGAIALSERKVLTYQKKFATAFVRKLNLAKEFSAGLASGQFRMYYQPQVDAFTGMIIGAEALIRWEHPQLGMISPGEFIPLAEQNGFIVAMGEWSLLQACRDAKEWPAPMNVSVNVSGVQLRDPRGVLRTVKNALADSSLQPERLTLEITESAMFGNEDETISLLGDLRKTGIAIALDDFGTGYSSLAYISRLDLDKLKIDQSFVRELGRSQNADSMIALIMDLARLMKLRTIAEGVETESQAAALQSMGCDWFQGYLYGKPMPQDRFLKLPGQEIR